MDDRCASCGAGLATGATWCGQCYSAVGTAATAPSTPFGSGGTAPAGPWVPGRAAPVQALPVQLRKTRWGKTPTTFGPMGRTVATLALLVPLSVMLVGGLADPFVWGGAAVWGGILMPWALRDIWKAGQVPAT
jgi:hypothetical protein